MKGYVIAYVGEPFETITLTGNDEKKFLATLPLTRVDYVDVIDEDGKRRIWEFDKEASDAETTRP